MNITQQITEAKDVVLYKKLLKTLGGYSSAFPATGVDGLFDTLIDQGKKILPSDKQAIKILDYIISNDSEPAAVQKLLNVRFADLPVECRPVTKKGNKHEVAFWETKGIVSDKVKSLLDFDGSGKGKWSDMDGKSVTLIDIVEED